MRPPLEHDWTIEYPLPPGRGTLAGGIYDDHILLDPDILPRICVHCAGDGVVSEKFFFTEELPRVFWKTLGAALLMPVLLALTAIAASRFGGPRALGLYGCVAGLCIGAACMAAGFYAARKATGRGRYALTFYLCRPCERTYRLLSKRVLVFSWAALGLFTMIVFSPLLRVGAPERARPVSIFVMALFATFLCCVAAILKSHFSAQKFRGLSAYWSFGENTVRLSFSNMAVAALASGHRKNTA